MGPKCNCIYLSKRKVEGNLTHASEEGDRE